MGILASIDRTLTDWARRLNDYDKEVLGPKRARLLGIKEEK